MAMGNKTLEDLLNPISKQLGHDRVAESVEIPEWEYKAVRVTDGLSHDELVDMFAAEAEKVRVQVRRCAREDLATCVAEIVGQGTPETGEPCEVVVANDAHFAYAGLNRALREKKLVSKLTVWNPQEGEACIEAALHATYGITYAAGGIAETGTVVQPTSPNCGRAVSLLPLVHIAVVDASTIVATMGDVLDGLDERALPSQICFISGPSATADIELVRVEGVHGPMYVYYVIVG